MQSNHRMATHEARIERIQIALGIKEGFFGIRPTAFPDAAAMSSDNREILELAQNTQNNLVPLVLGKTTIPEIIFRGFIGDDLAFGLMGTESPHEVIDTVYSRLGHRL